MCLYTCLHVYVFSKGVRVQDDQGDLEGGSSRFFPQVNRGFAMDRSRSWAFDPYPKAKM